ncbi:MAG: (d)CMP kinase, partial [Pseudomonadota bacterium]
AERRFKELSEKGMDVTFEIVLADVKERDERDRTRAAAPLIPADDAVLIDTSDLSIADAVAAAVAVIALFNICEDDFKGDVHTLF